MGAVGAMSESDHDIAQFQQERNEAAAAYDGKPEREIIIDVVVHLSRIARNVGSLSKRVDALERWRWYLAGAIAAAGAGAPFLAGAVGGG